MTDINILKNRPRLLAECELEPVQTKRFQPTGFPDLGAAEYSVKDRQMLLVESAQSMANRLESVCWDTPNDALVPCLSGLPYIHVSIKDDGKVISTTSTLLEAHRLNSPYILKGKRGDTPFETDFLAEVGFKAGVPVDRSKFIATVFKYDPCSLLHGLFLSQLEDGRLRLARALSAFIEAENVKLVQSGGVKNDRINPSGETKDGYGNVPFARTEYTAEKITAFMNLDLRQIRSYGLSDAATDLLIFLSLYKIQAFLETAGRLRTACDLERAADPRISPDGFKLPELKTLEEILPDKISACSKLFAKPAVTKLDFTQNASSAKASKAKTKA